MTSPSTASDDERAGLAERTGALAREYLARLLAADRMGAMRLVLDAVDDGVPIHAIYLDVFQRTQWEIGRLWETAEMTVAQEHFCTAATQMIMSQLYPRIFSTERRGRRLVATCVGGDLHELGMRMVSDFFEMDGWDTYYLGANTPTPSVVAAVREQRPDVLAVSATLPHHVPRVGELIAAVRAEYEGALHVIVGGYPFNLEADLWRTVRADGHAASADDAVRIANALVDRSGR